MLEATLASGFGSRKPIQGTRSMLSGWLPYWLLVLTAHETAHAAMADRTRIGWAIAELTPVHIDSLVG